MLGFLYQSFEQVPSKLFFVCDEALARDVDSFRVILSSCSILELNLQRERRRTSVSVNHKDPLEVHHGRKILRIDFRLARNVDALLDLLFYDLNHLLDVRAVKIFLIGARHENLRFGDLLSDISVSESVTSRCVLPNKTSEFPPKRFLAG